MLRDYYRRLAQEKGGDKNGPAPKAKAPAKKVVKPAPAPEKAPAKPATKGR